MLTFDKRKCLLAVLLLQHTVEPFLMGSPRRPTSLVRFPCRRYPLSNNGASMRLAVAAMGRPTKESQEQYEESNELPQDNTSHDDSGGSPSTKQRAWGRRTKDLRKNNAAMGDAAFLRKRTANLLELTSSSSEEQQQQQQQQDSEDAKEKIAGLPLSRRMKVGRKTFNFLIDAWAFSGELDAADQALKLLKRMEEIQDDPLDNASSVAPDVRSYTKVINAVSRSMRPDAGDIAEDILDKMDGLYESGVNIAAKPNTYTYTAVIESFANSGAEGSAQKADELLERMIRKHQEGDQNVTPTARCFNAVMNAYAKSGRPGAVLRVEELFSRLESLYMSGVEEAKPNTFNYNSLITALANSQEEDSAGRASDVLDRMEANYKAGDLDCKPSTVSFNSVIDAYAKSRLHDGAEQAERVVLHMEELYESGEDVQPNTRSFNSVINAWAKSPDESAALKAQDLISYMITLSEFGNKAVRPDTHSFSTAINAWARSKMPDKAQHAKNLFERMVQAHQDGNKYVRPNVIAVNAVMNACAYTSNTEEQKKAMEIAHSQLKWLESSEHGEPDQVTYGTFLKVCANQMPDCDTRQQIISVIFKKCIKAGQVGSLVLQQLKVMAPPDLYFKLTGKSIEDDIKMEDLPKEYWANVVEGRWRRRRTHS